MTAPTKIAGVLRFLNASKSKAAAAIPDKKTNTIDPDGLSRQGTVLNIDAAAEDFDRCLRAAKGMATEATMGKIVVRQDGERPRLCWVHAGGQDEARLHPDDPRLLLRLGDDALRMEGLGVQWSGLSPDGRRAAIGGYNGTLWLFDLERGELESRLIGHKGHLTCGAWGADALFTGEHKPAQLIRWGLADGSRKARAVKQLMGVAVGAKGAWVIAAVHRGPEAPVFDGDTLAPIASLGGHHKAACAVAASPDGLNALTFDEDATLRVWSAADWSCTATVNIKDHLGYRARLDDIKFLPGTRIAALQRGGSLDNPTLTFDLDTHALSDTTRIKSAFIDIHPDGLRAIGAGSSLQNDDRGQSYYQGHVIDIARGQVERAIEPAQKRAFWRRGHDQAFFETANGLAGHDPDTGLRLPGHEGHLGAIDGLAFSPDGLRLASGCRHDRSLHLWDLNTGRPVARRVSTWGNFHQIAWTPDRLAVRTSNYGHGELLILNPDDAATLASLKATQSPFAPMALSPDGRIAAVGNTTDNISIFDLDTLQPLWHIRLPTSKLTDKDEARVLTFSRDGALLIALLTSGRVAAWRLDDQSGPTLFDTQGGFPSHLCLLPDGLHLAVCARSSVDLHALDGGLRLASIPTPSRPCALAAHGDTLAVAHHQSPTILLITDPLGAASRRSLDGHAADALAFSPDGARLASGGCRGDIAIWSL